jgi:lipoyl(octanoyl) transferase
VSVFKFSTRKKMIFYTRIHCWDYLEALATMHAHADQIKQEKAKEEVWFLEHLPVYTMGPCTTEGDIPLAVATAQKISVVKTNRGGQATYHGPGQRVVYVLIHLKKRQLSVHDYIRRLETWIIQSLYILGVSSQTLEGHTGVWFLDGRKVASLGIRVCGGVALHGFALNVCNVLTPFEQITACGDSKSSFSSVSEELKRSVSMKEVDLALIQACPF